MARSWQGGKRSGSTILKPAKISMGGIIWTSHVPANNEEANAINEAMERLCLGK